MFEWLEKLLDIDLSNSDISLINITKVEEGDTVVKEGDTLHVNMASLSPEQQRQVLQDAEVQFNEDRRCLRYDEERETKAIEEGFTEQYREILSYYEPYIDQRYYSMLEKSFHLRGLIERNDLSREEIRKKRRQLSNVHGPEAYYLSGLVTAMYFDPDGGFHDILWSLEVDPEYDRGDFQDILEMLIEKKLICVFVEYDDDVSSVTDEVISGLARYQEEQPIQEWFDIRGIGDRCEDIIQGVVGELQDEFFAMDYDMWREDKHVWVRIYPRSVPNI